MNEYELKEKLEELDKVVVELDQIIKECKWWKEPEIIARVRKLIKDRDELVEKINEMLKEEEQTKELKEE